MLTQLKIRNLDLGRGVAVSPMVGITDLPFRRLCREFGADLTFTEMVAGPALAAYKRGRVGSAVLRLLATEAQERPFGVQLFGGDPESLHQGAKVIADRGAQIIDFNMGCPARRVVGSGSGSSLLRDPKRAAQCVAAIRSALPDLPFTVKIRAGWDPDHANGVEMARIIEGEGADGLTVHARFRSQNYGVEADWDHIARVVEAVRIPVLGNGDVMKASDAVAMVRQTGCAGVMLARGVLGNPWLVREVRAALEKRPAPPRPDALEKMEVFLLFWRQMVEHRGMERAIKEIRKHLVWFSRGLRGAHGLRRDLWTFRDEETMILRVREFFHQAREYETNRAGADAGKFRP